MMMFGGYFQWLHGAMMLRDLKLSAIIRHTEFYPHAINVTDSQLSGSGPTPISVLYSKYIEHCLSHENDGLSASQEIDRRHEIHLMTKRWYSASDCTTLWCLVGGYYQQSCGAHCFIYMRTILRTVYVLSVKVLWVSYWSLYIYMQQMQEELYGIFWIIMHHKGVRDELLPRDPLGN